MKLHEKEIYTQYQTLELENWKRYLAKTTPIVTEKFNQIIERYHFDNLQNLDGEEKEVIRLELFHSLGNLDFSFSAFSDSDEFHTLFEPGENLFEEYVEEPIGYNFEYPENMDIFWEEYRDSKVAEEMREMGLAWIIEIWQKCGGHRCGTLSGTLENNSVLVFNLTLMHWEEYIDHEIEPKVGIKVDYPLIRDLTIKEIESRVRLDQYSKNEYLWRYFEKGDDFAEIGLIQNHLGRRSGKISAFNTIPFDTQIGKNDYMNIRFHIKKQISSFCDEMINSGYFEKERPSEYPKIVDQNLNWLLEYSQIIKKERLIDFQQKENITIPLDYLRHLIFSEENESEMLTFRKDKNTIIEISAFYSFSKIVSERQSQIDNGLISRNYLAIAETIAGNMVLINATEDQTGLFLWNKSTQEIEMIGNSIEEFLNNLYPTANFHPKVYHLGKDNIYMVRKWITAGWDVNEILYNGFVAINLSKSQAVSELLLQHGADVSKIKNFGYLTPNYLQLFLDYGADINQILNKWNKEYILRNDDYKKFHHLIKE